MLFRWALVILHLLRMRRNVNRNVFKARKNVSATTQQIGNLVGDCAACNTYLNKQQAETSNLRPTGTPDLPWVEIAADIFEWERSNYLVTVDY